MRELKPDFTTVTEVADDHVSVEQVERAHHRYMWAQPYCKDKDVLEIACGVGQGLGILGSVARSLNAGDIEPSHIAQVKQRYAMRVHAEVMDATRLPFADGSLDVVIIFEALYYLRDPAAFAAECRRVLRLHGVVLVCNANKDMEDFSPSPYSQTYHGATELTELFGARGFAVSLYGYWPYAKASRWQRMLVPIKKVVVKSGLMPKTMHGKKLLKRVVFGQLIPMPAEIEAGQFAYAAPTPIPTSVADRRHRVIYCAAMRTV